MRLCTLAPAVMAPGGIELADVSGVEEQRKALEEALKAHHQVGRSEPVTFTYRPTPPSGPPPEPSGERAHPDDDNSVKED